MAFDNLGSILQSPAVLKYLANMNAGMQQGFATPGISPGQAIGMGSAQAMQGQVADLTRQQEMQDQLALEEKQRQILANRMQGVLGEQPDTADQYGPQALMKKALAMTMSGDPRIMQMGGTLMNVAGAMTPKERYKQSTVKVGGYDVPYFVNEQGKPEFIPGAADLMRPSKVVYDKDLRQFVDERTRQPVGAAALQSADVSGPAVSPQVSTVAPAAGKVPNYFDVSPVSTLPSTGQMPPSVGGVDLLPGEKAQLAMEGIKAKQQAEVKAAAEKELAASETLKPENIQNITNKLETNQGRLSRIGDNIKAMNEEEVLGKYGPDWKAVKQFRLEHGSVGNTIALDVNNLYLDTLQAMKDSGVSANKIADSQKEGDRILSSLLDATAPYETQKTALSDLKRWHDQQVELTKTRLGSSYKTLGGEIPSELTSKISSFKAKTTESKPDIKVGSNGKTYVKVNGKWQEQ